MEAKLRNIFTERRYGKVVMNEGLYEEFWSIIKDFYTIIPVQIDFDYLNRYFTILFYCKEIRVIEENSAIPKYNVEITQDGEDKIIDMKLIEIK